MKIEWQEPGVGYLKPLFGFEYGIAYWDEYRKRDIGWRLTEARKALVAQYLQLAEVVDIGIGGGAFVEAADCRGYDINPQAICWLIKQDKFWPVDKPVQALTFWDSFEHIEVHGDILDKCLEYAFISVPIFESESDVLESKHFKPNEHLWYFTDAGLKSFMLRYGFECVTQNTVECQIGREGIGTYVFKRIGS